MTPREIEKRLYACRSPRQADLDRFVAKTVPPAALYMPDCVARAHVEFCDWAPRFEFADGREAQGDAVCVFVFAARDGFDETIDLVAWEPKSGRVASWLGLANVLGGENVYRSRLGAAGALLVHETPVE
jgi:hypothetical protein